jgi:hypothetical protein
MWAIAGAPIIVATNILNMTDIMKTVLLNKDMIAVHQDALAQAGDRRGFASDPGCGTNNCQIWYATTALRRIHVAAVTVVECRSKNLQNGDIAAVMYNKDNNAHTMTLNFGEYSLTYLHDVRGLACLFGPRYDQPRMGWTHRLSL